MGYGVLVFVYLKIFLVLLFELLVKKLVLVVVVKFLKEIINSDNIYKII